MNEIPRITVRSIGLSSPESQEEIERHTLYVFAQRSASFKTSLLSAELSHEVSTQLKTIEEAAKEELTRKMRSLGVHNVSERLPEIQYVAPVSKDDYQKTGYYHTAYHLPVIVVGGTSSDIVDLGSFIMHELSHTSTSSEIKLLFQNGKIVNSGGVTGMEVGGGNFSTLASGIENGLAVADQVDFFRDYLSIHFPKDYNKRLEWYEKRKRRPDYQKIDKSIFGPIYKEATLPFLYPANVRLPLNIQFSHPALDINSLKNYLMVNRLCEVIGNYLIAHNSLILPKNEAAKIGRNFLDEYRYKRSNDAHSVIVRIFRGRDAKILFSAGDRMENIDHAMKVISSKEKR
ncbi:hypothetical protein A3D77_05050 [Candidatus Gottesmanbacteria bacterium RIFCSPHIGHO2_02_FULL_39_11]|uniref:Uncharacterized protein n=1 Tax=Candidatus Gottesmanbacteria bacterium RIFCSPHIGHO2_02_FULL_39_11 TaxID=1798382 RepID=A0A1F5ZMV6_9BACT|nr:MAG: hypothetical protein A3D77_05050 [Candidatus Gottesmanbacteria bacterium RIFCSPHIGHO2_02_FULL_39_11]